ncbi:glycosyltransferase [Hymenobacter aquaticus]|uniref:Glycosyltransferase n=1 Tax=Hymenobacter aquaticus TaxID=1867101 RepID=A0A4Z0QA54_9BACT|nr:glycosyltransferase [Hymenobacter aquaticus]TGE26023.1 glycosyltransferase [Hymenobacter aquaticus]
MTSTSSARLLSASERSVYEAVPRLHVAPAPAPQLRAVVIIPVKDEADNLPHTLQALADQLDLQGRPLAPELFEIIVLANNCHDQSAAVARRFARAHPHLALHVAEITLPPAYANIGWARRLLMDEACRRLEVVGCPGGFIASTDGDTRVAPTWLALTQAELLTHQVAAVTGRILAGSRNTGSSGRRHHLRDTAYRLLCARLEAELDPCPNDPWPRHHQHFGASFAITVAAYRRVGGLPTVPYLEDQALYQALQRHDLRVRHSPSVRVFTSDRHEGRVAVGLSWQLREWELLSARQQEPLVPGAACLVATLTLRRQLRHLWQEQQATGLPEVLLSEPSPQLVRTAQELNVSVVSLLLRLRHAPFGELWHWVEQEVLTHSGWTQRWAALPLSQALLGLRQKLAAVRAGA